MRPYEVMAIFEATTEPSVIQGVLDRALDVIRSTGGNPGAIDRWGKRSFAYEVNHKREGYYVVVEFTVGARDRGRPRPDARPGRRGGAPQGGAPARPGRDGRAGGELTGRREDERSRDGDRQQRDPGGERHPRPRVALHQHRPGQRDLRARGQPALAEPPDPGVGGGDVVLRRRVLAGDGREREREHHTRRRVMVAGRLEQRSWETQEGDRRSKVEVVADEIGPSLRWATAQITKNERRGPGEGSARGGGGPPTGAGTGAGADTRRRCGRRLRIRRGALLMARNNQRGGTAARRSPKDLGRRVKKKPCALCRDKVEWVDYKDVPMLRKYMSDRGKIRSRRVTGNCAQHQRALAMAIKTARELVLLPYTQRTVTERPGGRGGARPGRADPGRHPAGRGATSAGLGRGARRHRGQGSRHGGGRRRGDRRAAQEIAEEAAAEGTGSPGAGAGTPVRALRATTHGVLLRDDVAGVGRRGDIVKVAGGFARNFLLPAGRAIVATEGVEGQAALMRRGRDLREAKDRAPPRPRRRCWPAPSSRSRPGRRGADGSSAPSARPTWSRRSAPPRASRWTAGTSSSPSTSRRPGDFAVPVQLFRDVEVVLTVEVSPAS